MYIREIQQVTLSLPEDNVYLDYFEKNPEYDRVYDRSLENPGDINFCVRYEKVLKYYNPGIDDVVDMMNDKK